MSKNDFKSINFDLPNELKAEYFFSLDFLAHYDLDGVSFSPNGVVIASDGLTTEDAPLSHKMSSRFRIRSPSRSENFKRAMR